MGALWAAALFSLATLGNAAQPAPDPTKLLQEADRLAWLRAWSAAEPSFAQAQKLFAAQGDQRNALYAEVSAFRGQLPRMSVPAASARLAEYLEHPLVQSDDRLRLRVLVIKGETDEDLDPTLAAESWREAQALAEKLGDAAWANRARGELGLVAFLQGDVGGSVIGLGQAVKVAQSNGDVSSLVRWLTLFGHGYVQLGRPAGGARLLRSRAEGRRGRAGAAVPGDDARRAVERADPAGTRRRGRRHPRSQPTEVAAKPRPAGYQAQLLAQRALDRESEEAARSRAWRCSVRRLALAKAAGGNRIVAEIALDAARIQRSAERTRRLSVRSGRYSGRTSDGGTPAASTAARGARGPPVVRSAASRTRRRSSTRPPTSWRGCSRRRAARGSRAGWSAAWTSVFVARIRLEGTRGQNAEPDVHGHRRGARPSAARTARESAARRRRGAPGSCRKANAASPPLQRRLLQDNGSWPPSASARPDLRRRGAARASFHRILRPRAPRGHARNRRSLRELQSALRPDEVFVEFALMDPASYVLVATRVSRTGAVASRGVRRSPARSRRC